MSAAVDLDARRVLNLGCGRRYDPLAVNLDITPDTHPDVLHDLEQTPWPFPDARFDHIEAIDVIEHLSDSLDAMQEIHRILALRGRLHIVVPHFSAANAYTDLTHRGFFGWRSFDYLTGEHEHDYYTRARFRMVRRRLWFKGHLSGRLVQRIAERWPEHYEDRWAWMFPAWFLDFELEKR